jgi:hypothetical protein
MLTRGENLNGLSSGPAGKFQHPRMKTLVQEQVCRQGSQHG